MAPSVCLRWRGSNCIEHMELRERQVALDLEFPSHINVYGTGYSISTHYMYIYILSNLLISIAWESIYGFRYADPESLGSV